MKKTIIAAFSIIAILSGCASSTPEEARALGPERQYQFSVSDDYQVVYRRIVDASRKCHQANLLTATMMVNSDLYPDTRTGTISVGLYGVTTAIYQVIDVRGTDTGTTVHAAFPIGPVSAFGDRLKAWATGGHQEC